MSYCILNFAILREKSISQKKNMKGTEMEILEYLEEFIRVLLDLS